MSRHTKPIRQTTPTPEQMDRINDVADAIAELLDVPGEDIGTRGVFEIALTVDQAERLVEMARRA